MTSQIKTILLLGLLTALILFLGQAMGGRAGLVIALGLALVMNFASYWWSDKIVLSMYKAQELSPADGPWLHAMVEELSRNAGIPKPRICLIPQDAPNAFATGRNPENAVVAVTQGIMQILSPEELRGVLAHELAHIKNRDILIQSVAAVLGAAIMSIAHMLQWGAIFGLGRRDDDEGGASGLSAIALAIIAPIAAMLIQMAISRSREYLADETGAAISGRPLDLANALGRLDAASRQIPLNGSPVAENLFIVNPFTGADMANLFSTHPPIPERIARLREMARRRG
ncbi:Heat shock protein. Metallo peptidase. MEROPS family M48B [Humidesulfovibrio mexicanus]|uniref:Protease HtpX homolog n=1 Tax=Humidesulfovibrio mexicanus TaxID=147047 RepID=A0A238Z1L7_9BACT|nr:zinc metalloprotease HtpX [Humidesulfovibrio mexicanus]SNR76841.1 Heat shock protein. Metallo peptidase. MEROPS family M48B [Humidesulfovibrio mexicanus]